MNGRKRTCWVFIVNVLAVSSLTILELTWKLLSSLNSRVRSGKKEITKTITQHTCTHIEQWNFGVWYILNVWQYQKRFIHELFISYLYNSSKFGREYVWFRELNLTNLVSAKQLTWVVLIQTHLYSTDVAWMHDRQFNDIYVFNKSRNYMRKLRSPYHSGHYIKTLSYFWGVSIPYVQVTIILRLLSKNLWW